MRRVAVAGILPVLLLFGWCVPARAVIIDFESFPAWTTLPSNFLAGYGIESVTDNRADADFAVHDYSPYPYMIVPSGSKVFVPAGGTYPSPYGYFETTLTFASPVTDFSFSKAAVGSPYTYTYGMAGWKAEAFDQLGGLVDQVQEGLSGALDFPSPPPPERFTLDGAATIKTVKFTTYYYFQSTHGSVPLDDFEFTFAAVPEPAGFAVWALLGTLAATASWWRRKRGAA